MAYFCYMLECVNGALYTGWTKDPLRRLKQHAAGRGARYTSMNAPARLVYVEEVADRGSALSLEARLKRLRHTQKVKLLSSPRNCLRRFLPPGQAAFTSLPEHFTVRAPGRVNLLGEHVDYNDGIVLPAAIDRFVTLDVLVIKDPLLRLEAVDFGSQVEIPFKTIDQKQDSAGQPLPAFARYPAGVAWALMDAGYRLKGLQVRYASDIPVGAGLSSSAAVEVAFALGWQVAGGLPLGGMELARLCGRAESEYVGVRSGLMDQFASYFGQEGCVLAFDTQTLGWQALPLPAGTTLVIADSGERRVLAGSAYNDRREECQQGLERLQMKMPGLLSLRDLSPADLGDVVKILPPRLGERIQHVVEEMARVEEAAVRLQQGDAAAFGRLMSASHASLRDLFKVSTPSLDFLVEAAKSLPGCYGAKLTGAGFGGCTVSLVASDEVAVFVEELEKQYLAETGQKTHIFAVRAANGACRLA